MITESNGIKNVTASAHYYCEESKQLCGVNLATLNLIAFGGDDMLDSVNFNFKCQACNKVHTITFEE